jgi:hypothetical protein
MIDDGVITQLVREERTKMVETYQYERKDEKYI